jgi:hypothetical protein
MAQRRQEPHPEPNQGDGPWGLRSWVWYFAPAPVVLVVAVMIYTDAFIVVGVIALVVFAVGAFLWHQLSEWW